MLVLSFDGVRSVPPTARPGVSESSKIMSGLMYDPPKMTNVDDRTAISRVGEALAGRYAEIGQAIAARIVDEIPDYRGVAPDVFNDLSSGASATVELLTR